MRKLEEGNSKVCSQCGIDKPIGEYYMVKNRPSHRAACKLCMNKKQNDYQKNNLDISRKKSAKWRKNNPERWKEVYLKYQNEHRELVRERCSEWRKENLEYARELGRQWAKNNPEKCNASAAKRRAALLKATPAWADMSAINTEYALSKWCSKVMGIQYHVDHIIPLRGKNVCGLHVHNNLQVIPATDNHKKFNKFNTGV